VSQKQKQTPRTTKSNLPAVLAAVVVVGILIISVLSLNSGTPAAANADQMAVTTVVNMVTATADAAVPAAPEAPTAAAAPAPAAGKQYPAAPPMTIDVKKTYTATIKTPRGDIVVKLRPDLAPETVNSFVFLARDGYYNGLTWHRVLADFMAQGGDPTGTGMGGPGYTVKGEFSANVSFDKPGYLAMARPGNDVNGNGSQFFITTAPATYLDNQYTIFGEVTAGQDIVKGIPLRDPQSATTPGEAMESITISEQ
jgi:peptidylprolyl isomerase